MMKVTLLGTGTPWPDLNRQGPAVLIEIGKDTVLFDTGRGVVYQALKAKASLRNLNPIFLTHHHFDHIGDLFDVIISSWTAGRTHVLKIFGPPGTSEIVSALVNQVYARDIQFRVAETLSIGNLPWDGTNIAKIETKDVEPGLIYKTDNYQVSAEYVQHHYDADPPRFDWPCLGYRITSGNKSIVISGDTVGCEGIDKLSKGADLLVHCCIFAEVDITDGQKKHLTSYVLPSSGEVGEIAAKAGVSRLLLTHINSEASSLEMINDIRKKFNGEVILGSDLLQVEV